MLKPFLKDTVLYSIGVFAIRLINFILMPFLTRRLSVSDYGVITLLLTFAPLVLYILTLQISQAIPKFCANNNNELQKREYISTAFWFVIFMYCLFYAVANFIPNFDNWMLGITDKQSYFQVALINICLFGIFTYLETQLRWDHKALEYVIVTILMMVFSVVLIFLFVTMRLGITGYFLGSMVGQLIGCLAAYLFSYRQYQFKFSLKRLKEMLHFTTPLSISALGGYLFANVNQWLIRIFCNFHDLGIYGVASRFASVVSVVFGCISLSLTPLIYAKYQSKEMPAFISLLFRLCFLVSLWIALFFTVFQHVIVLLTVGNLFLDSGKYIPLTILSYALSSFYIFTPGQWLHGKTAELAKINLIAGVINLTLAAIFIHLYSLAGAVISLLIASIIQLVLNIIYSNKYYKINYYSLRILTASVLFLVVYSNSPGVMLMILFLVASSILLIKKEDLHLIKAIK